MEIDEKIKIECKKLGERIKSIREKKNISLEELSLKTGIRKEYLRKIEHGIAYGVKIEHHLLKISKSLRVKFYELFNYD